MPTARARVFLRIPLWPDTRNEKATQQIIYYFFMLQLLDVNFLEINQAYGQKV